MATRCTALALSCLVLFCDAIPPTVPTVQLKNAATGTVDMPVVGAGTGGYTGDAQVYGAYPECFNACYWPTCAEPDPANFSSSGHDCHENVQASIATWISLGGRRIDGSASYHSQRHVTLVMNASGVPRSEFFLTTKVGPYLTMGYNETMHQLETTLRETDPTGFLLGYVDLALVHWPSCASGGGCAPDAFSPVSSDPPCIAGSSTYDEVACRLSTYRALVDAWHSGRARAIGVSNYNSTHLQEIIDAGLPLPAVNQIPFHLFHSSVQAETIAFCVAHGVLVNGYSPFGVPDHKTYNPPAAKTPLLDPVANAIAASHGVTPAALQLAWQWAQGIVVNPRSMSAAHMLENLGMALSGTQPWWVLAGQLTASEMQQLSSRPQQ